jgi:hypothetical protein
LPPPSSQAQADAVNNEGLPFALQLPSGGYLVDNGAGQLVLSNEMSTLFSILNQVAITESGQFICAEPVSESGLFLCSPSSSNKRRRQTTNVPVFLTLGGGNIFSPLYPIGGVLSTAAFYDNLSIDIADVISTDLGLPITVGAQNNLILPYVEPPGGLDNVASYAQSVFKSATASANTVSSSTTTIG